MAEQDNPTGAVVTIKKYANRRLYNTATSSYVTLDHLAEMVKQGTQFVVTDAKTGHDEDLALRELAYLLNDNVEVITTPASVTSGT